MYGLLPSWSLLANKPAMAQAQTKRLVIIHTGDGLSRNYWPSSPSGQPIALSPVLSPFSGLEAQLSLVRGFTGATNSHTGIQSLFTGATCEDNAESTTVKAASLDQFVSPLVSAGMPFPSIAMGAVRDQKTDKAGETFPFFGPGGQAINPKLTPRQALDSYFSDLFALMGSNLNLTNTNATNAVEAEQLLPYLQAQTNQLLASPRLGAQEKQKLELHAQSLRKMLESLANTGNPMVPSDGAGNGPSGPMQCQKIPAVHNRGYDDKSSSDYEPMIDAYMDSIVAGISCRKSNVFTLQLGRSADNWQFPKVGQEIPQVKELDSHRLAHDKSYFDGGEVRNQELFELSRQRAQAVCTWYASKVANLARKLSQIPDGEGTALDNTLIVWASEFGPDEAKKHRVDDLGFLLIGGKNLGFASGKYFDLSSQKKANSVLLTTIAQAYGVTETVGREGGSIPQLKRS
jgi:hypothetical protein